VVPVTEELLFRAAFLTILVAVLVRIRPGASPTDSAITINGLAFGLAHGANATSLAATFVLGQVVFATALGMVCAGLMLRTRSVLPAIALHGVVNAVVVIA
jgi:membrane protease YdiL (CAAX protease family)